MSGPKVEPEAACDLLNPTLEEIKDYDPLAKYPDAGAVIQYTRQVDLACGCTKVMAFYLPIPRAVLPEGAIIGHLDSAIKAAEKRMCPNCLPKD